MTKIQHSQEILTLPTYKVGPANVNPILAEYREEKPYPYLMFDELTNLREDVEYKALVLENEYLKLTVLPELGGKLYSVIDKRNGESLFYLNHVVKPQLVGLTGAWTSGGIEFNFPFGHRPTAMNEIHTNMRENKDGSVSVFVGETDHISGVRFSVELRLIPGNACMEETVRIYNPTSLPERYFFWNTASYPETEDLECRYPVQWMIEENSRLRRPWPMNGEVDVRESRNIQRFSSVFTAYADKDFFGVYDRKKAIGNVHVANHREVPGKKFWSWGMAEFGVRWNLSLTDEDGGYMEHQAGDTETQFNYHDFLPYQKLDWKEYWYQVFGIGPFTYANEHAVITIRNQAIKQGNVILSVSILANEHIGASVFRLVHNDSIIFAVDTTLSPAIPLVLETVVSMQIFTQGMLQFELVDAEDRMVAEDIIRRTPSLEEELDRSEELMPDIDHLSSILVQIRLAEERRKFKKALDLIDDLLVSHPNYLEAHIRRAILLLHMGLWEEAEKSVQEAARLTPFSDELHYYTGLVRFMRSKPEQARRSFLSVHSASPFFPASQIMLGKLALLRREWRMAERYFSLALADANRADTADVLRANVLRRMGRTTEALVQVNEILERDPLYAAAAIESDLLQESGSSLRFFQDDIHDVVHLLQFYDEIGDMAAQQYIIDHFGDPKHPILLYHRGLLAARTGDMKAAESFYEEAERGSLDLIFPNQSLTLAALQDADRLLGERSLRTKYYLGLVYYARERWKEAEHAWSYCLRQNLSYSVLNRNMGYLLWMRLNDPERAISVLEEGRLLEPVNPDISVYLNRLYKMTDRLDRRIALLAEDTPIIDMSQAEARMRISLYNDTGEYDRAWEILSGYGFRNWEAEYPGMDIRALYHETRNGRVQELMQTERWDAAIVELEQSMIYPENTGLGLLSGQIFPREWYFLAVCHERKGDIPQTIAYCDRILAAGVRPDSPEYAEYVKAAHKKAEWEWIGFTKEETR
jgi:tetratricopeptide (TPR) repeat protein